jgi:hypothetical protein
MKEPTRCNRRIPAAAQRPHRPHHGYAVTAYKEVKTHDGVAFTATQRFNRTIIGTVENEGMGGPDLFHPD